MAEVLTQKELGPGTPTEDRWYISNRRGAVGELPFGRLQFHSDMMWAGEPCELVSLYAVEVEPPRVPARSSVRHTPWKRSATSLVNIDARKALHLPERCDAGNMDDVILTNVKPDHHDQTAKDPPSPNGKTAPLCVRTDDP